MVSRWLLICTKYFESVHHLFQFNQIPCSITDFLNLQFTTLMEKLLKLLSIYNAKEFMVGEVLN